mmetsp:Transcript_61093/g.108977  ORF Transcript_61093/g.108977 Transcript_61093/m.108977 type:complete len:218 (-) Transcript_61093:357-1010(-)
MASVWTCPWAGVSVRAVRRGLCLTSTLPPHGSPSAFACVSHPNDKKGSILQRVIVQGLQSRVCMQRFLVPHKSTLRVVQSTLVQDDHLGCGPIGLEHGLHPLLVPALGHVAHEQFAPTCSTSCSRLGGSGSVRVRGRWGLRDGGTTGGKHVHRWCGHAVLGLYAGVCHTHHDVAPTILLGIEALDGLLGTTTIRKLDEATSVVCRLILLWGQEDALR